MNTRTPPNDSVARTGKQHANQRVNRRTLSVRAPSLAFFFAFAFGCAADLEGDPKSFSAAFRTPGAGAPQAGTGNAGAGGSAPQGGMAPGGAAGSTPTAGAPMAGTTGMVTVPPDPACVTALFTKSCNFCHMGTAQFGGGLDLTGANLGQRLVTAKAKYMGVTANAAACKAGALIIDPVNKEESVMLRKVRGTQTCGDKMPLGTGLMGADLQCIETWIMSFAAANFIESPEEFGSADIDAAHP